MKKIFMILLVICAVCMSSMERETQAQDILQQIYSKIDSVPRMETMIDSLITLLATMDIYIAVDTLTVEADSLNWMMTYLLINSDSALVDQAAVIALLTSLVTKATARNAALDSSLWWSDSTDTRYAAFITWYDSIGTLLIANSALLATANTWHDSTAYLQDAIAISAATIAAGVDTTIEMTTAIRDTLGLAIAPDITLSTASLAAIETDAAAIEILNTAIRDSIGAGNADLTLAIPDIEEIRVDAEAIKVAAENMEDTLGLAIAPDVTLSTASLAAIETDAAAIEVLNTAIRDSIGAGNAALTLMTADLDAIATLQNSIYARLDSIMHIFAVPSTRRIDASADWANATLTRVIHTAALDTFQGHYWSFALANDAAAACTLWTYSGGVADQGNDGWPLKPGESVGHLTNYPAPIDSFSFSKTAADLLKWIIIGR